MQTPSTILHIPHSSTVIPQDVRDSLLPSDAALSAELLAMTDAFTDELFRTSVPAERVVYPVSRLVVDPERFVDDAEEAMAARGMGVIYTMTSSGAALRRSLTEASRRTLLERFYFPHHAALSLAVERSLAVHGRCLVLDCHSFPSIPLPHERDQDPDRPAICLGTDPFHTPAALYDQAANLFRAAGFTVFRDRPFAGTLVPNPFYRQNSAVQSLMIELNRNLYMKEEDGTRRPEFSQVATALTPILDELASVGESSYRLETHVVQSDGVDRREYYLEVEK